MVNTTSYQDFTSEAPQVTRSFELVTSITTALVSEMETMMTVGVGVMEEPAKPKPRPCVNYCDMDRKDALEIIYYISVVVLPCLSIFGIFGNISSILVLSRQSLAKSSNILLIALAVGDLMYLLGNSNIMNTWRAYFKTRLTYQQALGMYVVYMIQATFLEAGSIMSILLSMLITVERVIAVYLPLKFPLIVTKKRTLLAVSVVTFLAIFKAIWPHVTVRYFYNAKKGVPLARFTTFYFENKAHLNRIIQAYDYGVGFLSLVIICVGCFMIGVKVSIAAKVRAKMLSKPGRDGAGTQAPRVSRTTRTLLAVSIMFLCTQGTAYLIETVMAEAKTWLFYIMRYQVTYILYALSSASNFIIYVVLNKIFRETYLRLFVPCWKKDATSKPTDRAG